MVTVASGRTTEGGDNAMGKRKQLKRQVKQQQRTIAELERRLEERDEQMAMAAEMVGSMSTAIHLMRT